MWTVTPSFTMAGLDPATQSASVSERKTLWDITRSRGGRGVLFLLRVLRDSA